MITITLWFEACLPDGLYSFAEVVKNMTTLNTAACWQEFADDTGDVITDVEGLWIIHANTFHTEAETTNARKDHRLTIREFFLQYVLQLCDYADDSTFREPAVTASLLGNLHERYFALTYSLSKVFAVRTALLNIVPYQSYMYCHQLLTVFPNLTLLSLLVKQVVLLS